MQNHRPFYRMKHSSNRELLERIIFVQQVIVAGRLSQLLTVVYHFAA